MKELDARRMPLGTRVVYKPTGEIGTVVEIEVRRTKYNPIDEEARVSRRIILVAVHVKHDSPDWLRPLAYYHGPMCGRKVKDLERL